MKTKVMLLAAMALFICCNLSAQSNIDKIVDEIEQKGVDVNKVVKRDPKTKQVYSSVKSLTFYSKDSKYANRLKEAFKKDAENAVTETVNNHGNNYTLIFHDGKKRAIYTMQISKGLNEKTPKVYLSIMIKDGDSHDFDWGTMNIDGLDALKDLSEHDWDEFGQAMEKWGDKFGRDMEKWGKVFEKKMENLGKELEMRKIQKRIIRRKADSIRHIRESMKNEVKPKQA